MVLSSRMRQYSDDDHPTLSNHTAFICKITIQGTRTSEEPTSEQPTAVEASKESKDDKNEEKMDTSGSPQSPWGEPAGDPVLGNILCVSV